MFDGKYPDFFILDSFLEKYPIYFKFAHFVKTNINIGLTDSYLRANVTNGQTKDGKCRKMDFAYILTIGRSL